MRQLYRKCIRVEFTTILLINIAGTHMQTAVITSNEAVQALLCTKFVLWHKLWMFFILSDNVLHAVLIPNQNSMVKLRSRQGLTTS